MMHLREKGKQRGSAEKGFYVVTTTYLMLREGKTTRVSGGHVKKKHDDDLLVAEGKERHESQRMVEEKKAAKTHGIGPRTGPRIGSWKARGRVCVSEGGKRNSRTAKKNSPTRSIDSSVSWSEVLRVRKRTSMLSLRLKLESPWSGPRGLRVPSSVERPGRPAAEPRYVLSSW